ncbi:PTS IIA-like nitrogen regulatory protein PtsN [Pseudoalteromonas spongiae]|uniref:PTS IIA-like nitrogen regulatory protein PtsN n=1 Tax=Pseudoalteromonas spongiae TaxID=298657 RepID=UPI003736952C
MKLTDIIAEDCAKTAVLFNSKKRLFEFISDLAHQQAPDITSQEFLEALLQREKLGSTGIGKGLAIPHGRIDGLQNTIGFLIVNQSPIPFDAIDDKDVDIFIVLLIPEQKCQQHLQTLATIADKLKDKQFCRQLRYAENNHQLYQIISSEAS